MFTPNFPLCALSLTRTRSSAHRTTRYLASCRSNDALKPWPHQCTSSNKILYRSLSARGTEEKKVKSLAINAYEASSLTALVFLIYFTLLFPRIFTFSRFLLYFCGLLYVRVSCHSMAKKAISVPKKPNKKYTHVETHVINAHLNASPKILRVDARRSQRLDYVYSRASWNSCMFARAREFKHSYFSALPF